MREPLMRTAPALFSATVFVETSSTTAEMFETAVVANVNALESANDELPQPTTQFTRTALFPESPGFTITSPVVVIVIGQAPEPAAAVPWFAVTVPLTVAVPVIVTLFEPFRMTWSARVFASTSSAVIGPGFAEEPFFPDQICTEPCPHAAPAVTPTRSTASIAPSQPRLIARLL